MECKKNPSRQLLVEQFYRERAKLLNIYCDNSQDNHLGICVKEKVIPLGNGYLIPDYSTRTRKLNAIKQGKGSIQLISQILNDYGKTQGSPGGFGSSPKNRF